KSEIMSEKMPNDIASIRDAAIQHALNGTPLPDNIDELYEWLIANKIYGGELNYDFYFHLADVDLSDEALRWTEELDDTTAINDHVRLIYDRQAIENYVNGYNDHLLCPESIKLENASGEATYACGMSYSAGQGGIEMNWQGFYASREEYLG
ncbi:MAG: hypothetical protein ACKOBC_09090, partial [Hyphomicrobiales bacterium]